MVAIKLAVAGTHSTGKSTLLAELAGMLDERGLRVERVADLASEARELGFPILRDHTFESTLWIMAQGIATELKAGLLADVVLVDRPVLDALGYLWAALAHRGVALGPAHATYLIDLARHHAATYHILCKTELDGTIPLGKDRDPDPTFRADADSQITAVFSQLGIAPRIVEPGQEFVEHLAAELAALHSSFEAGRS